MLVSIRYTSHLNLPEGEGFNYSDMRHFSFNFPYNYHCHENNAKTTTVLRSHHRINAIQSATECKKVYADDPMHIYTVLTCTHMGVYTDVRGALQLTVLKNIASCKCYVLSLCIINVS